MKVVIIGGVAGGASCAARLRRLDETAEIVMVERGPYVSYANCGLPYHVGGVIPEESELLVATAPMFKALFKVDARTNCEAIAISPDQKTVDLKNHETGEVTTESYDKLVLSPGAPSIRPPLPGIDLPGIFEVRTVPDAREIRQWLEKGTSFLAGMHKYSGIQAVRPKTRAVVVGGGFIGLEMTENLIHRGFDVTLLQRGDQLLGPLDQEMARVVEGYLENHGVNLALNDGAAEFRQSPNGALEVHAESGAMYPADIVVLAIGVRPDTALAKAAGLEIGELGGIRTDEQMRTSEPDIFAAGDAVEVRDFVTGEWSLVALAGPANRQGRIAADVIAGRDSRFRGSQGTAIIGLFEGTAAWTGASEKNAAADRRRGLRKDLPVPEFPRRLLPRCETDRDEGPVPQIRRAPARRTGVGRGRRGQAHQRHGHPDPDERHSVRSRGIRTLLRAAVRQRQGPGELFGNGRGRRAQGRYAAHALARIGRWYDPRRARTVRAGRGECRGLCQYSPRAAARPAG